MSTATIVGCPPMSELLSCLASPDRPIAARMRSVFYLRSLGGADAVAALCAALADKRGSALFRHEVAYVLGQMRATSALPALVAVLADASDDVVVRHEAGEALGAIGDASALPALLAGVKDSAPEVAQTCEIAAARLQWLANLGGATAADGGFHSVDPAPGEAAPAATDVPRLAAALLDTTLPLFDRYRAMFSLRNARSEAAVRALCAGLRDASPLFRHEVAYVLGQLAHPVSASALMRTVSDATEHEMVRHEAAESLGAIGTPDCEEFLQARLDAGGAPPMLRESCQVALDITDYWSAAGKEGIA